MEVYKINYSGRDRYKSLIIKGVYYIRYSPQWHSNALFIRVYKNAYLVADQLNQNLPHNRQNLLL